jgi:hypothetical protein
MLAPMAAQNPRDPDPFKPLVPPRQSQTPRDSGNVKAVGVPIAAAESFAALVAWAAGGGPLFIGVSGTFDETEWLRHRGSKTELPRTAPPTTPAAAGSEVLRPAIPEGEGEDEAPSPVTTAPR